MTEGVPLVIPEVNQHAMKGMKYGEGGIIANPNCSTIIALMAVTPLHRAAKVTFFSFISLIAEGNADANLPESFGQCVCLCIRHH